MKSQQEFAKGKERVEDVNLSECIDDALMLTGERIVNYGIEVKKNYYSTFTIQAVKTKLIHVLMNFFKNACESLLVNSPGNRFLEINILKGSDGSTCLKTSDNGSGIKKEDLAKMFTYGFTTKKDGHGFGLHACAKMIQEMGGSIFAESEGEGKGAVFTITFPAVMGIVNNNSGEKIFP